MARVAIYSRVSTSDQNADNQLEQLRTWCARAGHDVVVECVDYLSGAKSSEKRPQLAKLLDMAHKREFDLCVFWALDRLSREGMSKTIAYLQILSQNNIAFHSYTEPALCSDNEMVRDIVLAVLAALAKAERQKISERTKAGLERVRRHGSESGKPIGRPALDDALVARIKRLRGNDPTLSAYAIAKTLKIDPKTVRKHL